MNLGDSFMNSRHPMKLSIAGTDPSITRPLQFPDRKFSKKNNDAPTR